MSLVHLNCDNDTGSRIDARSMTFPFARQDQPTFLRWWLKVHTRHRIPPPKPTSSLPPHSHISGVVDQPRVPTSYFKPQAHDASCCGWPLALGVCMPAGRTRG